MRIYLILCWFLALCTAAMAAPSCGIHQGMSVVDLSQPITTIRTESGKSGVEAFKVIGIKTVARYYDWIGPETTCKTLFPAESDAIIAAGLSIITIFQHENSDPETFLNRSRGATDAGHALKLAAANGQPVGSTIYFAVDGVDQTIKDAVFEHSLHDGGPVPKARRVKLLRADRSFNKHLKFYERFRHYHRRAFGKQANNIRGSDMLPFVEHYFREVNRVVTANGKKYKIGVYGSGAVCKHIRAKGLAVHCWLAMSTGWPGYKEVLNSGKWSMAQQLSTFCKGWKFKDREMVRFDFNRVNGGNLGQWSKKGDVKAAALPGKCKPSW